MCFRKLPLETAAPPSVNTVLNCTIAYAPVCCTRFLLHALCSWLTAAHTCQLSLGTLRFYLRYFNICRVFSAFLVGVITQAPRFLNVYRLFCSVASLMTSFLSTFGQFLPSPIILPCFPGLMLMDVQVESTPLT